MTSDVASMHCLKIPRCGHVWFLGLTCFSSVAPSQWLEVIQHVRMTAEVEFVNHESLFPQVGLLGGNFSLIDRGDLVPLSRKLLISTVSSKHDLFSLAPGSSFQSVPHTTCLPLSLTPLHNAQHSNMAQGARKLAEGVQTIIRTLVEGPTQIPQGKTGADRGSVWMLGGRYNVGDLSVGQRSSVGGFHEFRHLVRDCAMLPNPLRRGVGVW